MRIVVVSLLFCLVQAGPPPPKGVKLERLAMPEAQTAIGADTVVVIPLGAGLQGHGPHLALGSDLTLTEHLAHRVMEASTVAVAPALAYHLQAAPDETPALTTLAAETARDLTIQVVRTIARSGPRRFYVLNTSATASVALNAAASTLAREGIVLRFSNLASHIGAHASEAETSMLLHIDTPSVNMERAGSDASGAAAARGKVYIDTIVTALVRDIEALRRVTPPELQPETPVRRPPPGAPNISAQRRPSGCTAGDERAILDVGYRFTAYWTMGDVDKIGALWSDEGDLIHPDGAVERGRVTIIQNRREQFRRKEYRSSKHSMNFGGIRCLTGDVAVADGKWELTGVYDAAGNILPRGEGLVTVVLKKGDAGWIFEAYRYTVTQPGAKPPTLLKKPGYPDK